MLIFKKKNFINNNTLAGILFSLLLHSIILSLLTHKNSLPKNPAIFVELINENILIPKQNKKQIVSNPDSIEVKKPLNNAKLLSEKNHITNKQTIKRGESNIAQAKKKLNLRLPDPNELTFNQNKKANNTLTQNLNYGIQDNLPNIEDGEITLLNTKSYQFAGFVRRVALQVFNKVKNQSWLSLPHNEIRKLERYVVFDVYLNTSGEFEKIILKQDSKSKIFDQLVKEAIESSAHDPNPPKKL